MACVHTQEQELMFPILETLQVLFWWKCVRIGVFCIIKAVIVFYKHYCSG